MVQVVTGCNSAAVPRRFPRDEEVIDLFAGFARDLPFGVDERAAKVEALDDIQFVAAFSAGGRAGANRPLDRTALSTASSASSGTSPSESSSPNDFSEKRYCRRTISRLIRASRSMFFVWSILSGNPHSDDRARTTEDGHTNAAIPTPRRIVLSTSLAGQTRTRPEPLFAGLPGGTCRGGVAWTPPFASGATRILGPTWLCTGPRVTIEWSARSRIITSRASRVACLKHSQYCDDSRTGGHDPRTWLVGLQGESR